MSLWQSSREFVDYLQEFEASLPVMAIGELSDSAGGVQHLAVVCVDLVCGFVKAGPLASSRVDAALPAVIRTLELAENHGVRHLVLVQDGHRPDAAEFANFAPHCVTGTAEAEAVPELLDFLARTTMRPVLAVKNSLSAVWSPDWMAWERRAAEEDVRAYIVVGDCTDLCVANLVLPLVTRAHEEQRRLRVVLPADCLATYDLPVAAARQLGVMPHGGDLLQAVFLYYMALAGAEVVRALV